MDSLDRKTATKILTIGPNYKDYKGGIGAVMYIYSIYFKPFKVLITQKEGSALNKISLLFISYIRFIYLMLSDRSIKIIHIHGSTLGSLYRKYSFFIMAKYIFRKKVIYHIHGSEYAEFYLNSKRLTRTIIQHFINNTDCVICLSQAWKSFFEENFSAKKVAIIPNIIDYPSLGEKQERDYITFLFLGLIGSRKGIFDLLQVIIANKDKYCNKIKLIVGGNGEIEKLTNVIKESQIEEIVDFVGWVSKEDKIKCLQNADIFVLPSYNEGLPISILEAMAYEKPIISTPVGGISEIVLPNKNGLLVEAGNLEQIKAAIDFFLDNPEKYKPFGLESKRIVKKHLPDSVLTQLSMIYQSLLQK